MNDMISKAKIGTDWLSTSLTDLEIKQNFDLGMLSSEIEFRRHELKMSQKDFARLLGVNQSMVSKYESGEYNFSINLLNEICSKIGLSFSPSISKPESNTSSVVFIHDISTKRILDNESLDFEIEESA